MHVIVDGEDNLSQVTLEYSDQLYPAFMRICCVSHKLHCCQLANCLYITDNTSISRRSI